MDGREDMILDGERFTSDEMVKFVVRTEKF